MVGSFPPPTPSPIHQRSILWVFEATQNRKKLKQGCEIRGSNLGPLAQRRCANRVCHLCSWKMFLWESIDIWKWVNLNDSVFLILLFILTHLKMIIILSWVILLMSLCAISLVFCIWSKALLENFNNEDNIVTLTVLFVSSFFFQLLAFSLLQIW